MSSNDTDILILEAVIGFLRGPVWNLPIQHFMEQYCFEFDVTENDELDDATLKECKKIHKEYKELVDSLLNTFLKDMGFMNEQFVRACDRTKLTNHPSYYELLEQIWSADNFELFKSQMIHKNIELELQALVLLQYQLGLLNSDAGDNDDQIMAIVIKKSKDEYDRLNSKEKQIAENIANSCDTIKVLKKECENTEKINNQMLEMHLNEEGKILKHNDNVKNNRKAEEFNDDDDDDVVLSNQHKNKGDSATLSKLDDKQRQPIKQILPQRLLSASKIRHPISSIAAASNDNENKDTVFNLAQNLVAKNGGNLNKDELERRAEFMRKQRELLIERKKAEREKALDKYVKENEKHDVVRPMSSRIAKAVISGNVEPSALNANDDKERKKMEARKALADTLRKEVVNKSSKK